MNFKRTVNSIRRNVMRRLTKRVGLSGDGIWINQNAEKEEIKRILISRPNHRLGNLLSITPLLQEVIAVFPDAKIDLFVRGNLAATVFKNYKQVDQIIQLPKKPFKQLVAYINVWLTLRSTSYDLVINVIRDSSSGRMSTTLTNSKHKLFGDGRENELLTSDDHKHIAKKPVYYFRDYLAKTGVTSNENSIPYFDLKLDSAELEKGKATLRELVGNEKKTICLFTNATGKKCYSESWWGEIYALLKKEYPDFNIIEILPVENISKISFQAPVYANADVRVVGAVIASCSVFIGADSGVMHLASAVQTPTVGLFSVTDLHSYQPYNKGSVGIDTNQSQPADYIKTLNKILR